MSIYRRMATWVRDLVSTVRLHANPRYREAIANIPPPSGAPGVNLDEMLARLEDRP